MNLDEFEKRHGKNETTGCCTKPDSHLGASESRFAGLYLDTDDYYRDTFAGDGMFPNPAEKRALKTYLESKFD